MPAPRRLSREESRAETRRRLLDAAESLFAERGFAAASVEDLAAEAGYSRGAFYWNFEDKADLFMALLEDRSRARIEEIESAIATAPDPATLFLMLRESVVARPAWLNLHLEFCLYALRDAAARERLAAFERSQRDAYAEAIAAAVDRLGIDPGIDVPLFALLIQTLEQGLELKHRLDPAAVSEDVFFQALTKLTELVVARPAAPTRSRSRRR